MTTLFHRKFLAALAAVFLAAKIFAADTNATAPLTREDLQANLLQVQAQIHSSQIVLEQAQQAALDSARSNADQLTTRIHALEQSIADERSASAGAARRAQQNTLLVLGGFGVAALGLLCLLVYFLWRAFTQIAQVTAQQNSLIAQSGAVHQLAAPGRLAVESSNAQLLDVVGRLERRILELEGGQKMLPAAPDAPSAATDLLAEGQAKLDAGNAAAALGCFEKFLIAHPRHAEAHVKRAAALEKLGRDEEALACCDRAIAADASLVTAHLHKGGLLNRLRRHDEALNCYEQALLAQEKKGK